MKNYSLICETVDEFNQVLDDFLKISKPECPERLYAFEHLKIFVNEIRDSAKVKGYEVRVLDKHFIGYLIVLNFVTAHR